MKRTHRLRRLAAAAVLGVGMVGSVVGVVAGTAGAATVIGKFTAKNPTTIPNGTSTNQRIGTLVATISKTAVFTGTITFTVADTTTHGGTTTFTVANSTAFAFTATGPITTAAFACTVNTTTVTCVVDKTGATTTVVVTLKTLRVDSLDARNKVKVTATTTTAAVKFSPDVAYPATYTTAAPTNPTFVIVANNTTRPIPPVGEGATGAAAGSWTVTFANGAGATATTQGVGATGHLQITVEPHTGTSACATTDTVAFDGVPKITVVAATGTTVAATKIKVTGSLSGNNGCTGFFAPNVLTVTFTTTVHFTKKTASLVLSISTVKYSVAPATTTGTVTVSDTYFDSSSTKVGNNATQTQGVTVTSTNAIVSAAYLTVKTPVTTMAPTSFDQPIGTVSVVETVPGTVPTGFVCVTLWDSTRTATGTGVHGATATFHATGGSTIVPPATLTSHVWFNTTGTPKVTNGTTFKFVTAGAKAKTFSFAVTATTSKNVTYTVSGLAVNTNGATTAMPLLTSWYSSSATCTPVTGTETDHVAVAFMNTIKIATQIYGQTADATAAAELEHAYPPGADCPIVTSFLGTPFLGKTERPVIVATDKTFPDALSSQFLAGELGTGTLLTHVTSLPQVTINALRDEGISHVYVVGGPLAVSTAVVNAIEALDVYNCGGGKVATNLTGQVIHIKVTRIYGQTQYDTAEAIAEYVPSEFVGTVSTPGAYGGGPTGNGLYNDTTGSATAKPVSGGTLKTAIVANGAEFQDSEAASALAWSTTLPILLTTPSTLSAQVKEAMQTEHIRQVIVLGGPLAVSNTVVKALAALKVTGQNVSVLRIGGKDYTDTAVQLANYELGGTTTGLGWTPATGKVMVARGNGYTDGIAGAVLEHGTFTGSNEWPLVLTENPTTVGTYLTTWLKTVGTGGTGFRTGTGHISHLVILGGPLAISPAIILQMEQDLKS